LHNIDYRYRWDLMYTYVGNLLIAINPYKKLSIFSPVMPLHASPPSHLLQKNVNVYSKNEARSPDGSRLAPHVFTIADASYRALCRSVGYANHFRSSSLTVVGIAPVSRLSSVANLAPARQRRLKLLCRLVRVLGTGLIL
jgi:hypothetical protein